MGWWKVAIGLVLLGWCARASYGQTGPSWAVRPQDTEEELGNQVTIQCQFYNREAKSIAWVRIRESTSDNLFINADRWTHDDRFSVEAVDDGTISGYNLKIAQTERKDDGEYQCELAVSELKHKAIVIILGKQKVKI